MEHTASTPTEPDAPNYVRAPCGLALISETLFVAATGANCILAMHKESLKVLFKWGKSGKGEGQFDQPHGLAIAKGLLFVADTGNHRVQAFTLRRGVFVRQIGGGTDVSPSMFVEPQGLATAADFLFVSEAA
eukprot:2337176-Prymnesium_polylepis.1